jgi:hypothetical protein
MLDQPQLNPRHLVQRLIEHAIDPIQADLFDELLPAPLFEVRGRPRGGFTRQR